MESQSCCQNGNQKGQKSAEVAVVMVPFLAQGHLNQFLHLSHHLVASYGIPVHYAGSAIHNRQAKLRFHGWDPETSNRIEFHDLQLPPYSSPSPNPNAATHFPAHLQPLFDASMQLREPLFQVCRDLSTKFRRIVIIHDSIVGSIVQDVKLIPNAEAYVLVPTSAFQTSMGITKNLTEKPFQLDPDIPTNIPSNEGCFTSEFLDFAYKQIELLDFQSGKLFNTCRVIEARYLELLERLPIYGNMKTFAIGPLNPVQIRRTSEKQRHECLDWLDKQEENSVIYVSFGSTTAMTDEQITELAKGLEQSGQKFIWVLRKADKGDIFMGDEEGRPQQPEGYEERVKDRGMVVRDWAPQLEILGHPSTGGFMSHCGWNSCIESISMGVPVVAWPMHSDQPRNATLLTEVLRIGLLIKDCVHLAELVTSDTIEDAVRRLMTSQEGEEMKKKAAKLGEAVRGSVAEGGASRLEMDSFIAHITR